MATATPATLANMRDWSADAMSPDEFERAMAEGIRRATRKRKLRERAARKRAERLARERREY